MDDRGNGAGHRWKFFRAGGFDQVRLETAADLAALDRLDQKLWMALTCPTNGLEMDGRTLEHLDTDRDGRIRVPEILAAVRWVLPLLKNPDDLTKGSPELPLAAINDATPEGKCLLKSARHILASLGRKDAAVITADDTADAARLLAQNKFNGDGIVPVDCAEDEETKKVIAEVIDCLGAETDHSGLPGISQEKLDRFFADVKAYDAWCREGDTGDRVVFPLGGKTDAGVAALKAVQAKVEDYFARCRLAAFDDRSLPAMNRPETEYLGFAGKSLSLAVTEAVDLPLAKVAAGRSLPLKDGLNPAWAARMEAVAAQVVRPLLGDREALSEAEWFSLLDRFAAYENRLSRKAGASVEKLGIARIREILAGGAQARITDLIDSDRAVEAEFDSCVQVDRLVRYHRNLFTLLNNFVSFSDFYTRKAKAVFQAGTLYLDGRSCDLCIRVDDPNRHALLAALSKIYLAYCDCTRRGGTDKMTIAAAFTGGDSDFLMPGRNGLFYDRAGQDWDATIVKVIEHPISIRQAFWSPYKQTLKMIGGQIQKLAAARAKAASDKAAAGIAAAAEKAAAAKAAPAAPAPFDVAKFAGIFAAVGLPVGAIGTAIAAVVTGFLKLNWWQMPLALAGLILIISGPSMIIAWLKLRQRNLGPLLDANGWAVNARARINIPFGGSLTKTASLPEGAERSLQDPFAEKKSRWPYYLALVILLGIVLYVLNVFGLLSEWTRGLIGHPR